MRLEITDKQALDLAWCLLASIDAARKLGLKDMAMDRLTLLRTIAPAQAEALGPIAIAPSAWLDATQCGDIIQAIENMIRFLRTQPTQRERLHTYQNLLVVMQVKGRQLAVQEHGATTCQEDCNDPSM